MARDCRMAGEPSHTQLMLKRVSALFWIGPSRRAVCQLMPPSKETSTCLIRPRPDQARPETLKKPLETRVWPPDGVVMTDLHSWIELYWRCRPLGSGSV